jgi:glycosyltransferase involved in cell wall biosynthesis
MRVIMVGNDTSIVEGRVGKFAKVLDIFREGWERVDIILPSARKPIKRTRMGNVHFHVSPRPKHFQTWFVIKTLRKLLNQRVYDLIVLHNDGLYRNGIGVWWIWRQTGIPVISEIFHVPGYPRSGGMRDSLERILLNLYVRWAKRHVLKFRTMNHKEVPEYLKRVCGVPEDQILVVPATFTDENFYPREIPKSFDLIFCGRLVQNKGLDLLLASFVHIRQKRPGATLLIKGEGPMEDFLWKTAKKLGVEEGLTHIRWVENVGELAELYSAARILICTSYNEGGPRVTVEAMACQTPVISTRVGIMPEIIKHGTNGFLVDWDPGAIAKQILELLGDPGTLERVGAAGRKSVSGYSAGRVVGNYITTFQAVVSAASSQAV